MGRGKRAHGLSPAAALEKLFPNLASAGYEITSAEDPRYNCIAWAADDVTRWWEPVASPVPGMLLGGYYWPDGVDTAVTLPNYVRVMRRQGFRECESSDLEVGWQKVAIYVDSQGVPTHAARQLESGQWTSKCGRLEDIRHNTLEAVGSPSIYGTVAAVLRRPLKDDLPEPGLVTSATSK